MNWTFFYGVCIKWPTSLAMTVIASCYCVVTVPFRTRTFRYIYGSCRFLVPAMSVAYIWSYANDQFACTKKKTTTVGTSLTIDHLNLFSFFSFQTEDTDYEKQSNDIVLQVKSQARQQTQTNVENKKNWFTRVKRAIHNPINTMLRKGFVVIKTEWSSNVCFWTYQI